MPWALPRGSDPVPALGTEAGLGLPTARATERLGMGSRQGLAVAQPPAPAPSGSTTGVSGAVTLLQGTSCGSLAIQLIL